MSRRLRLPLFFVVALLACVVQPRAQVIHLTPHCDEFGIFAWGQFSDMTPSPGALRSNCDGTVPLPAISNASDAANQVAAFSGGRGVAFNGNVDWSTANPFALTFPPEDVVPVRVWVLHMDRMTCDIDCVRLKMAAALVWANTRLRAERTGIQLTSFVGDPHWVSDETMVGSAPPVNQLLDFSESGPHCNLVSDSSRFPTAIKRPNTLNLYVIRTEQGLNHRGVFCHRARAAGFANAFVAYKATDSTILHELSHNLGLSHFPANLNVMNADIQDGAFFTEGQAFWMNFSSTSVMTIFGPHQGDKLECSPRPAEDCPAEESWIWPDP